MKSSIFRSFVWIFIALLLALFILSCDSPKQTMINDLTVMMSQWKEASYSNPDNAYQKEKILAIKEQFERVSQALESSQKDPTEIHKLIYQVLFYMEKTIEQDETNPMQRMRQKTHAITAVTEMSKIIDCLNANEYYQRKTSGK